MVKRNKTNKLVNSDCKKATYKRKYKSKRVGQLKLRNGKPYCIKPNRNSKYINKLIRGKNKKSKKNSKESEVLAGEVESEGDTPKTITIKEMTGKEHDIYASFPLNLKDLKNQLKQSDNSLNRYELFIMEIGEPLTDKDTINGDEDIRLLRKPDLTPIENNDKLRELLKSWVEEREQFLGGENMTTYGDISEWNTIHITDMSNLFKCRLDDDDEVNAFDDDDDDDDDINNEIMFDKSTNFNPDISDWDVSNVTTMEGMFFAQDGFNSDISKWKTSNVENMESMFEQAEMFDQDISGWDVSNVKTMKKMFCNTKKFNQDISKWDTSKVEDMFCMFSAAEKFNSPLNTSTIEGREKGAWDVSHVKNMDSMFSNAFDFNQDISGWDVGNVEHMSFMFYGATKFNQDISGWDVRKVKDMILMFQEAEMFDQDISGWDINNVNPTHSHFLYHGDTLPVK